MALGKLLTPVCLCHQAVQLDIGQRAVTLWGWEGDRSGDALAMYHRRRGVSTYGLNHLWAQGPRKEDEQPA